jgi:hypothetical protein
MSSEDEKRPEESATQDEQPAKPDDGANKIGRFAQYTAPAMLASTQPSAAVS